MNKQKANDKVFEETIKQFRDEYQRALGQMARSSKERESEIFRLNDENLRLKAALRALFHEDRMRY